MHWVRSAVWCGDTFRFYIKAHIQYTTQCHPNRHTNTFGKFSNNNLSCAVPYRSPRIFLLFSFTYQCESIRNMPALTSTRTHIPKHTYNLLSLTVMTADHSSKPANLPFVRLFVLLRLLRVHLHCPFSLLIDELTYFTQFSNSLIQEENNSVINVDIIFENLTHSLQNSD